MLQKEAGNDFRVILSLCIELTIPKPNSPLPWDFLPVWCFITEDEKWCSDRPYFFNLRNKLKSLKLAGTNLPQSNSVPGSDLD